LINISILFCQKEKCSPSNKGGRSKDALFLKVIYFEPIFRKTVILSNFQDLAVIPIAEDNGAQQTKKGGVNSFSKQNKFLKPELQKKNFFCTYRITKHFIN